MDQNKIVPGIWFSVDGGNISTVIDYYRNIFGADLKEGQVITIDESPSGRTEICEVQIFGRTYSLMNTAQPHHQLNDSISFIINCEDQKEIDKYWDYFTTGGEESQCGWCIDKFGLRWQVIPENLGDLMSKPYAWEVMMSQRKIVIEEYLTSQN